MQLQGREATDRTEGQSSTNQTRFADHSLSTDEWAETGGDLPRRPFTARQFAQWQDYDGPLADMPPEKAAALLAELLEYFLVDGFDGMPLPPTGLPGAPVRKIDADDLAYRLVSIGYAYFIAAARKQARAMHNRWNEAHSLAIQLEQDAREALIQEQIARERARSAQFEAQKAEAPQLVYFIGSESGPIKIGIAANPEGRCKGLQTSHHEKLTVLATCEGGQPKEYAYHKLFANRRLAGEWFERCPEILAEIERLSV